MASKALMIRPLQRQVVFVDVVADDDDDDGHVVGIDVALVVAVDVENLSALLSFCLWA